MEEHHRGVQNLQPVGMYHLAQTNYRLERHVRMQMS